MSSTPDVIELRGLRLVGVVGILPEERTRPQPLEVDLDVEVDLTAAGLSDDLADTVDYGSLCELVADTVRAGAPHLLERLAAQLADVVLGADERIGAVEVGLRKLRPPVGQDLATSGVRVRRVRRATGGPTDRPS